MKTQGNLFFLNFVMSIDNAKTNNRIVYYDALKALAIYLVCIYHYSNLNINFLTDQNLATYINYFFYSILSMAVPLFFMVNGALLLNKPYNLTTHFKKLLYLYFLVLIWSFIYLMKSIFLENHSYSLEDFLQIWFYFKIGVNNNLWFLEALISIYLLFPFIKEIFDLPDRKVLKSFGLIIFIFSFGNLFINSLLNVSEFILNFDIFKENSFDFFPMINPFGNYYYAIFYFIAGGIISKKTLNNEIKLSKKMLLLMFSIALVFLFLYGVLMTISTHLIYNIVWESYYSIMTLIMSISTFIFFAKLSYKNEKINQLLIIVGSNTLGIYLIHKFVGSATIPYFRNLILSNNLPSNICYGFFLVFSCLLIVLTLKKLPILRKIVNI